jgi:uncharacterized protein (DUF1697 family)
MHRAAPIPADIQKAAEAVYARLGRGPAEDEKVIAFALMKVRDEAVKAATDEIWTRLGDHKVIHQVKTAINRPTTGA